MQLTAEATARGDGTAIGADRDAREAPRPSTRRGLARSVRPWVDRVAPALGTVVGVDTDEPVVALTFDDGPDPTSTPRVLERLDAAGVRATFFMLGEHAAEHPRIVNEVAEAGHAIGTHGWAHRSLVLDAPRGRREAHRWRRAQIERGRAALGYGGGPLFRPAYGHQDLALRLTARTAGCTTIGWSVSAGDWAGDPADAIAARVLAGMRPGAIVLFHDALADAARPEAFDRSTMLDALDLVLAAMAGAQRGVTVPELLELGPVRRRYRYPAPDPAALAGLAAPVRP